MSIADQLVYKTSTMTIKQKQKDRHLSGYARLSKMAEQATDGGDEVPVADDQPRRVVLHRAYSFTVYGTPRK